MEFPTLVPPTVILFLRRPGVQLALVAVVMYAGLLAAFMDPYASGSDTSGYLNHARLLANHRLHVPMRTIEGLPPETAPYDIYTPLGLKPAPDGHRLVPTYPAGLPLLLMVAERLVGSGHAVCLVLGAHSLLGLLLTYALGRTMGLPAACAAFGAIVVAVSPLYILYSIQTMSDVPSLVWVAAAVLAAWRAGETEKAESGKRKAENWRAAIWAVGSGAALAVGVLIRPNSVIALLPIGVALGLSPRRWLLLGLGSLPGALFFCLHAHAAYGSVFTTGYGDNFYLFSLGFIPRTLIHYARWLPILFTPVVVLALGLPWLGRKRSRAVAVLGAWILAYAVFYAIYSFTHENWWYLRFLLPAAPPLVVAGILVGREWPVFRRAFRYGTATFTIVVGLTLANGAWWTRQCGVLNNAMHDRSYPLAMDWLRDNVPANAVIAAWQATGALVYYTPFTFFRWERLDAHSFHRIVAAAQKAHRPIYAVLFPYECNAALGQHMSGAWTPVARVREITILRWDGEMPAAE